MLAPCPSAYWNGNYKFGMDVHFTSAGKVVCIYMFVTGLYKVLINRIYSDLIHIHIYMCFEIKRVHMTQPSQSSLSMMVLSTREIFSLTRKSV